MVEEMIALVEIEHDPWPEGAIYEQTFATMSNRKANRMTEFHFFRENEDVMPEMIIRAFERRKGEKYELYSFSKMGRFMVNGMEIKFNFLPGKYEYCLKLW